MSLSNSGGILQVDAAALQCVLCDLLRDQLDQVDLSFDGVVSVRNHLSLVEHDCLTQSKSDGADSVQANQNLV